MLEARKVALQLVRELRTLVPVIARHDRNLADQLKRAVDSVGLNLGEGESSQKGNKQKHYSLAHGSANEVRAALDLASAWGYVEPSEGTLAILDRLMRLLWGLTH
jgi:four helix bundle protein